MKRVIILLLDSVGIGAAKDADKYGDENSNTLGHIIQQFPDINLKNMESLGLYNCLKESCDNTFGKDIVDNPKAIYGYAKEISKGKDTVSGHWELMGCPVSFDWGYFTNPTDSFPQELLNKIYQEYNIQGSLGNCVASGTEILDKFGEEHIKTKFPIFYTSADSVFQIAAHEEHFGLDNLYKLCDIARKHLYDYNICRVIARPFLGEKSGSFTRTGNRKDLSISPHEDTLLDVAKQSNLEVTSIGKISDIFATKGITKSVKASGLQELFDKTLNEVVTNTASGIIFTNFVDFDSVYGHRRDVKGYKEALEYLDSRLTEIIGKLQDDDLLVITADHGCDPTWKGTDHTREYIPIMIYNNQLKSENIGKRNTFSDVGQSIATYLNLPKLKHGISFL